MRLEVELGRQALLDAVDDGQLGRALLGLLQQALRLVEQARVLQRHAHAGRQRLSRRTSASPKALRARSSPALITPRSPGHAAMMGHDEAAKAVGAWDERLRPKSAQVASSPV